MQDLVREFKSYGRCFKENETSKRTMRQVKRFTIIPCWFHCIATNGFHEKAENEISTRVVVKTANL